MTDQSNVWMQLFARSEAIAAIDPRAPDARAQLLGQLAAISTVYAQAFDPADQFEEYVAVALCQALERVVAGMESQSK